MKTNVSIKFNSIEQYRVIEKKLEEMGYSNKKKWNNGFIIDDLKSGLHDFMYILIFNNEFTLHNHNEFFHDTKLYKSLNEFLND